MEGFHFYSCRLGGAQRVSKQDLNEFLKRTGMTGNELAAKLGVHWTTISRWRNGREAIPKTVELALKWLGGESRIDAIGQNGNEGENYQS